MTIVNRALKFIGRAAAFGVLGLVFFLVLDIVLWMVPPHRGWGAWQWQSSGVVAVGEGYSVEFLTRRAHPWLAESDQKAELYGGTAREGDKLATIELDMNTGGRTRVQLYFGHADGAPIIQLSDRFGDQFIDARARERIHRKLVLKDRQFLGTFSGEAYPRKFVPASVLPEARL